MTEIHNKVTEMAENRVKKGLCGICPSGCGIEIVMKGERLHQIKPMEGHPLGIVCTRTDRPEFRDEGRYPSLWSRDLHRIFDPLGDDYPIRGLH